MFYTLKSVAILLLSFMMLCLGHGLLNNLVSIRASLENFPNFAIGFMGVAYFGGFIIGIYVCSELLKKVGHIRTFAGIASITSALAIIFMLAVHPFSWIVFRFLYGLCIATLYMVIESWLNSVSATETRARILSVYMILIYASFALGQSLLIVSSFDSYHQFIVASILISMSVVPLCLSPKASPIETQVETLPFKSLISLSPFGSLSCLIGGMIVGAIWALLGAFLQQKGIEPLHIIMYLSMIFIGALAFQYPLGKLIDKAPNKRFVIQWLCTLGAISNAVLFMVLFYTQNPIALTLLFFVMGGTSFPIYSLSMAIILDFVEPKYMVKTSGSVLLINGIGSMIGALICSITMSLFGANAFLIFCVTCLAINASGVLWIKARTPKFEEEIAYVPMARSTIALHEFDPRIEAASDSTEQPKTTSKNQQPS